MSSASGILPSYHRFVQPGQLFARRSFRPREKYLIILVFLTFGIVCFGAFFFLPDDFKANGGVDSVYRVYQRIQKAGPELLIPAPPRSHDDDDFESLNGIPMHDHHHGDPADEDVHLIRDKQKLQAKIDEEWQNQKVLEKPEVFAEVRVKPTSSSSTVVMKQWSETYETVPPEPSKKLPKTFGGEDPDPIARQRRDKVKEKMKQSETVAVVGVVILSLTFFNYIFWACFTGQTLFDSSNTIYEELHQSNLISYTGGSDNVRNLKMVLFMSTLSQSGVRLKYSSYAINLKLFSRLMNFLYSFTIIVQRYYSK